MIDVGGVLEIDDGKISPVGPFHLMWLLMLETRENADLLLTRFTFLRKTGARTT